MSNRQLEIHISDGKCKVIEGTARRTYYSTEEAVGLALLKLNPTAVGTVSLPWQDYLATRGVAFSTSGEKALNLIVYANQKRTIQFRHGTEERHELVIKLPPLLLATAFKDNRLVKASLWVVKPVSENKLTATDATNALCPFPYGNVYTHGGICWGTTVIRDLHQPGEVLDAFFNSGFNGDLYGRSYVGTADINLPTLVRRVGEVLPVPVEAYYNKSVAAVAQDINR